jgi:hypothetical protein
MRVLAVPLVTVADFGEDAGLDEDSNLGDDSYSGSDTDAKEPPKK